MEKFVIGIDYGTDSCRAVLVNTENGNIVDSEVFYYLRWKKGLYCNPEIFQYRQHPLDYIESLKETVKAITGRIDRKILENIIAISVDTTGSTPCAINEEGVPLALTSEFSENPNAMFILWKDHTSIKEAEDINDTTKNWKGLNYTKYIGGVYSSEWFFAKMLHILRNDEKVREAAYSFVEHCDYIPALLTGVKNAEDIKRSRCAAGHKAMWNKEFDGLPSNEYFKAIDPLLDGIADRLFKDTYTSDYCAGEMTQEWADELGLLSRIKVGIGAFDCHMGAVGGNIKQGSMLKVMGTSTCDVMVEDYETMDGVLVEGICGQVDGSVVPGMIGLEAGQSAFGDVYDWFKKLVSYPLKLMSSEKYAESELEEIEDKILLSLEEEASKISPSESSLVSLDWINGRRTPYANQNLKGAITGISLATDAPIVYRSLIEATAFGARAIADRFKECGIKIDDAIAIGGVAKKSPLNMQICANVMNIPIKVCESEQCVALGASIFAAVVGGVYDDALHAQKKMASSFEKIYYPEEDQVEIYEELYKKYLKIGMFFEKL